MAYTVYPTDLTQYPAFRFALEKAIFLALGAHAGQVDKANAPYILHCLRVMLAGETNEERIVGALHDVLEDSTYEEWDLRETCGFDPGIVDAVVALTKKKGQSLKDYYAQVKANPLALRVKRHDIDDNYGRLHLIDDLATRERLMLKYIRAREILFGEKEK